MSHRPRAAVVLAAGKGTRMRSELPKVLHVVAGRPLLAWVIDAARAAGCDPIVVVVGHGAEAVRASFAGAGVVWAEQREQKGTGHALAQARGLVPEPSLVLVLSGDVPLVRAETLEALAAAASGAWGAMAIADLPAPGSLGRVLSGPNGRLGRIVEAVDATPAELEVRTVNAGLYALPAPEVFGYLDRLCPDNAKGELYLTDALTEAAREGVALLPLADPDEALGVNTPEDLAHVDRLLSQKIASRHRLC